MAKVAMIIKRSNRVLGASFKGSRLLIRVLEKGEEAVLWVLSRAPAVLSPSWCPLRKCSYAHRCRTRVLGAAAASLFLMPLPPRVTARRDPRFAFEDRYRPSVVTFNAHPGRGGLQRLACLWGGEEALVVLVRPPPPQPEVSTLWSAL